MPAITERDEEGEDLEYKKLFASAQQRETFDERMSAVFDEAGADRKKLSRKLAQPMNISARPNPSKKIYDPFAEHEEEKSEPIIP